MKGLLKNIIVALPGIGDHYVDQIAFGPDGRMYFDVGTATNSGHSWKRQSMGKTNARIP